MTLHSINQEQRLYVLPCGDGFTCLGFDVCFDRHTKLSAWLTEKGYHSSSPTERGTETAYHAYVAEEELGRAVCNSRGYKCPILLEPRLIGLEGKRVLVTEADGSSRKFWVGKSTGWMPVHLEIENRKHDGGAAVFLSPTATVTLA
jgi:hypothetical protein